MNANLTEEEARVVLDRLHDPLDTRSHTLADRCLLDVAEAKLSLAIQSRARTWFTHLMVQGKSESEARSHVRHMFGPDVADSL